MVFRRVSPTLYVHTVHSYVATPILEKAFVGGKTVKKGTFLDTKSQVSVRTFFLLYESIDHINARPAIHLHGKTELYFFRMSWKENFAKTAIYGRFLWA